MTTLLLELAGQGEAGEGERGQRAEKSRFGFVSLTMFNPSVDYLLYSRLSPRH